MARLVVRIQDKYAPGDKNTVFGTNPGDVVCIVDDDHQFSYCELNNGHYRIIDVPGVPQEKLIYLCDHLEDKEGQMIQRRIRAVDHKADVKLPEITKDVQAALDAKSVALDEVDVKQAEADRLANIVVTDKSVVDDYAAAKLAVEDAVALVAVIDADPSLADYVANAVAAVDAITFLKPLVADVAVIDAAVDAVAVKG